MFMESIEGANVPNKPEIVKKEKKYKCSHCQRLFARLEHLQRHERIHTGVKPFVCRQCQYSFTRGVQKRPRGQSDDFGETQEACRDVGYKSLQSLSLEAIPSRFGVSQNPALCAGGYPVPPHEHQQCRHKGDLLSTWAVCHPDYSFLKADSKPVCESPFPQPSSIPAQGLQLEDDLNKASVQQYDQEAPEWLRGRIDYLHEGQTIFFQELFHQRTQIQQSRDELREIESYVRDRGNLSRSGDQQTIHHSKMREDDSNSHLSSGSSSEGVEGFEKEVQKQTEHSKQGEGQQHASRDEPKQYIISLGQSRESEGEAELPRSGDCADASTASTWLRAQMEHLYEGHEQSFFQVVMASCEAKELQDEVRKLKERLGLMGGEDKHGAWTSRFEQTLSSSDERASEKG
ncbi:hypothetical protein M011DRAFT_528880 [Sporormia fimetaria CBS 119925]|uniref:C2H2-type domain-containing protein n=1 Tax=Sporormia fimetaria CBS 119925 TaxID=1340428 RepID=A0A6A6V1D3_9PLEO|nr:hypothetical protein M011DRAFT_528880 [Sporormia fimetaria CBS 119925]